MKTISYALAFCISLILLSCGSYLHQPTTKLHARMGEETYMTSKLKSLPEPQEKVYAAVYKFRDQTGQYRPAENGANWSTAVTQGATNILIKALENSSWFIPVERENVSNLLNERKIIVNGRAQYADDPNRQLIPPLLFAGIILEGGIVSYDANIMTGGIGARYFGLGGSARYRQDRVSVYLRAISTQNGRIIKTVYTSKIILSQAVDGSLFRFVSFQRLLEAETGYTYNEPSELAVTEAIEKAVYALIMEGIEEDLWATGEIQKDSLDSYQDFLKERDRVSQINEVGREFKQRRGTVSFGIEGFLTQYRGDLPDELITPGSSLSFEFAIRPKFDIGTEYGVSKFRTVEFIDDYFNYFKLYSRYRFLPYDRFTPFLKCGLGVFVNSQEEIFNFQGEQIGMGYYGGGLEFLATDRVGINLEAQYHHLFTDEGDFISQGLYTDMYLTLGLSCRYYLGKKSTSKINIYE